MADYNFYFDICALCILAVMAFMTLFRKKVPTYQNVVFLGIYCCVFLTVFSEWTETLLQMHPQQNLFYSYAEKLAGSSYFLFHILAAAGYMVYVLAILHISVRFCKRFFSLFLPLTVGIILIVMNWFTPIMFYYDHNGLYHRAPAMAFFYLIGAHYILSGLFLIHKYRKNLSRRVAGIMISYILIIICGIIIQLFFQKMLVEGFCSTISLLLTYITIQSPSEMIDEEVDILNHKAFLMSTSMLIESRQPFITVYVGVDHILAMSQALGNVQLQSLMHMMADILKRYGKKIFLYRYSESSFAMVLRKTDKERAQKMMQELIEQFSKPWKFQNNSIHVDFYLWMLCYPQQYANLDELVNRNNIIMRTENRRGQVIVQVDQIDFMRNINMKNFLILVMKALHEKKAQMRLIPVILLSENRVRALEAVCFFPSENGNWINGHDFFDGMENNRIIADVDEYLLREICSFLADNRQMLSALYGISMKISHIAFLRSDFEVRVDEILLGYGITPQKLFFKLSETSFSLFKQEHMNKMYRMKEKGYHFLIDDVGIGFSYLHQLINAKAVSVNLNASMIRAASESIKAGAMIKDMVRMIHGTQQQVGVEGVNTAWQAEILRSLECDFAQGDFYAKPLTKEKIGDYLTKQEKERERAEGE